VGGYIVYTGEAKNVCIMLEGKSIGTWPHGRQRRRFRSTIKTDLKEKGCDDMN
jgi:hypothetical protein